MITRARLLKVLAIAGVIAVVGGLLHFLLLRPSPKVTQHYLTELQSVMSTPDSLENFFASVLDVWFDDGTRKLYALDSKTNCFVVFDTSLSFLYRVGRGGDAPNEFAFPKWIRSGGGMIYVSDIGHGVLKVLAGDGEYVRSIPLTHFQLAEPFAVDSSGYIIVNASFADDSLLIVYDTTGKVARQFGKRIKQSTEQETLRRNFVWPVVDKDGNIYVVFQSLPYIRKYSRDFQLLMEKDLSSAAETRWTLQQLEEELKHSSANTIIDIVAGDDYRWP